MRSVTHDDKLRAGILSARSLTLGGLNPVSYAMLRDSGSQFRQVSDLGLEKAPDGKTRGRGRQDDLRARGRACLLMPQCRSTARPISGTRSTGNAPTWHSQWQMGNASGWGSCSTHCAGKMRITKCCEMLYFMSRPSVRTSCLRHRRSSTSAVISGGRK